jgi:DUF1680 family protein
VTIDGVAAGEVRDGYCHLERAWRVGEVIALELPMAAERVYAHPAVRACAGRVAVRRGPVVYCAEEADNGGNLDDLALAGDVPLASRPLDLAGGVVALEAPATRSALEDLRSGGALYRGRRAAREAATLTLVPYALWGNRGGREMRVWLREG